MNSDKVSIVIPCRNEEKYISLCLDSIINSNFDKNNLEVFVCDGLSNDNTIAIINQYSKQYSFIKLLINEHQTTQFALNLGIRNATSDYIIILGAHAELSPDYISKCIEILISDPKIGCVGGLLLSKNENEKSQIIALAMSSGFGVGNAHFRTGAKDGYVDTVAFGAYKKEVFEKVGLFDEDLVRNQDDEFNFRVSQASYKIYLSTKIHAKYYVRSSFSKLFRQYFQYGYWKVYVNTKHKTITTLRQLVPMFFVSFLFIGTICSIFNKLAFEGFIMILIIYFLLSLISAFKKSSSPIAIAGIILSFLILHFSYGLGYIEGLIMFLVFKRKPASVHSSLSR